MMDNWDRVLDRYLVGSVDLAGRGFEPTYGRRYLFMLYLCNQLL